MRAVNRVLVLALMNQTSVQGTRVLLALYLLDFGAQPFAVGLLAATYSLFSALLSVPIGRLIDRIGARLPMLAAAVAGGAGMLLPYFAPGIPAIFGAAMGVGFANAVFQVALQNLVGQLGTAETRGRDFANYSLMASASGLIGPLVAGVGMDHIGARITCLVFAAIAIGQLAVLVFARIPMPTAHQQQKAGGRFMDLLSGEGIRRAMGTCALQNAGDSLAQFYLPVYCHAISLSATTIGVILAAWSAAAFVVRLALPQLLSRIGEQKTLIFAFILGAASLVLVPLTTSTVLLILLAFTLGLGTGATGPIVTMLMYSSSPAGRSGEAMGLKITVNHVTKVVSPVIYGSVANAFGLAPVFWLTAALFGAGGWINRAQGKVAAPPSPGA